MLRRPVLFIHGFDGKPQDWHTDGFPQFLVESGSFDPDLLHIFSYGQTRSVEDGRVEYDNEGDMRRIASRLARAVSDAAEDVQSAVDHLSAKSVARGGPAQVDLVCHSIGGLIARYYLSRAEPDEHGTLYGGNVRRLVMIATPQHGLPSLDLAATVVPPGSLFRRVLEVMEKLPWLAGRYSGRLDELDDHVRAVLAVAAKELRDPHTETAFDSPAVAQTRPRSAFLTEINAPGRIPSGVESFILYGDVYAEVDLRLFGRTLLRHRRSFGDLLVPVASASSLPNGTARVFPFESALGARVTLGQKTPPAGHGAMLPPTAHGNLRRHPGVQKTVLDILNG